MAVTELTLKFPVAAVVEGYVFQDDECGYCMTPQVFVAWLGLTNYIVKRIGRPRDVILRGLPGMCEN